MSEATTVYDPERAYRHYLHETMYDMCMAFYNELARELTEEGYERMDHETTLPMSSCLIPAGTKWMVTYESKPEWSFRVATRWNWYASLEKNPDPKYIQCYTTDLPKANNRSSEEGSSRPVVANSVGLFYDGKYHIVYGEIFDRKTRQWRWKDNSPESVVNCLWYEKHRRGVA